MKIQDYINPCCMISQTWPNSREKEGDTLNALEYAAVNRFYTAVQTVEVPYRTERTGIAEIVKKYDLIYAYCLARVLNENKLNLSDLDESSRKRSVDKVKECLEHAKEAGACSLIVISGPAPGDKDRKEALKRLTESMAEICGRAKEESSIKVIIEPLDYESHKKNTLGTAREALELCSSIKKKGLELYLCLDTAHMFLNNEDPVHSLKTAEGYVKEFHFCNCVTKQDHPLFGDRHIPFGSPGVLDMEGIAKIIKDFLKIGYFDKNTKAKPVVACEILKQGNLESAELFKYCNDVLQNTWDIATSEHPEQHLEATIWDPDTDV